MLRRTLLSSAAVALVAALTAAASPSFLKWPAWISIESPVNPYDATTRSALLLVHAQFREGNARLADLNGTAEGLVNGARRRVPLHFDSTSHLNVFGLRRQWPTEGTWLLRINLRTTTALVSLGKDGNVASTRIPMENARDGMSLPRGVSTKDVDSMLADAAKR
ncbi:MAG TPA: hypothetical protein VGM50_07540 [Gemmatimonadaceae bacterium]